MVISDKLKARRKENGYSRSKPQDITQEELIKEMERLTNLGWICFVKWTCERCQERVTCDLPNTIFTKGYEHTEKDDGTKCGCVSYPERFGLLIMGQINKCSIK
jgi:hypothetical protein